MAVIHTNDTRHYEDVVAWLVRHGGTFEGRGMNEIIVNQEQYRGLVNAGLVREEPPKRDQK